MGGIIPMFSDILYATFSRCILQVRCWPVPCVTQIPPESKTHGLQPQAPGPRLRAVWQRRPQFIKRILYKNIYWKKT